MKKVLLLVGLVIFISSGIFAQNGYVAPYNARYSPKMTDEELYDITFLQKMSKDDWNRFSKDPRFDAKKVADIKTKWKKEHQAGKGQQKSTQTAGESNCYWIEPTSDYEHPNTIQWPGSPGNSTDNYSAPINLGWNFNFFGQNFNTVVLTTKGTIALGNNGYIDFTPSAFPDPLGTETNQQYDHICGFWTDFDFGASGELYYLLTDNALYVNYINVGYWPNQDDKVNTFQMIITADGANIIPGGNNVQFTYLDMQFANSQISGANGGCQANNNIANVGCDRLSGTQHYAFGRFNLCNSTIYNGPYGVTNAQQDGVDWLDGRVIAFNTSVTNFNVNQPPIPIGEICDTVTMCVGETISFDLAFTSPEQSQTTSITWAQSGSGFNCTTTSGNAAVVNNATFTASAGNVGVNTVTFTATDNGSPAASTVVTYTFIVDDIVPPPIEITGVLNICAGQETELTATGGFDSYTWSNGTSGQTTLVDSPGPITVVGAYGGCSAVETVNIDVTPYFIPQLEGGNEAIEVCPGIDTTICVLGDYASYSWEIYPGYDGEFVPGTPTNEACAQVTGNVNGNYAIYVTDDAGCEGFNIKVVNTSPVNPCPSNDDNNGPHCGPLQSLDFCGYSVPPEDNLIVYGLSTNQNGWQGSYINIYIYPADGGPMETYFFTTFGALGQFDEVMIGAGDSIEIEYFANGNNFAGNSLWVFNCGQNSPTIINAPLTNGIVYAAMSTCYPTELPGTWTVTGPSGWSFSDPTQMTTTFTPTQYGVYELCFNNPNCEFDYCYNFEFALPPSLELTPNINSLLCDDETVNASLTVDDPSATGVITWSGSGLNLSPDNLSAVVGPYTGYVSETITATISNVCGSDSDTFGVSHQPDVPEPSLNDQPLCANGSVTLDPIAPGQDNPNLDYTWTPGNSTGSTLNVTSEGTYSVVVSNDCDASQPASAFIDLVPAATITSSPDGNILECDADNVSLTVAYQSPSEYTISWSGEGSGNTNTIVASEDGQYCWTVTDVYNCNTQSTGCTNVDISGAPVTTSGSADVFALCPRECEQLDIIASGEDLNFSWSTSCAGSTINSNSGSIDFCAENVPQDCLGEFITITGTVSNECGSDQAQWTVQSNACEIGIPNIFTPNGDGQNGSFFIRGLENYTNVKLKVFNRWGHIVYESDNYRNEWRGQDVSEGTYWYVIELPYGLKTQYEGNITLVR